MIWLTYLAMSIAAMLLTAAVASAQEVPSLCPLRINNLHGGPIALSNFHRLSLSFCSAPPIPRLAQTASRWATLVVALRS